jgi:acyl dehydratase
MLSVMHIDNLTATPPAPSRSIAEIGLVAWRSKVIEHHDIALFTEISGDRNPLHYDAELAARSRFGGIVVQSGVTSSLINAIVAEQLPGPGSVFLETNWRYLAPVRPGDVITASVEVVSARHDRPIATVATRAINQCGVMVLDGTAVVWRDAVVARSTPRRASGTEEGR